MKKIDLNSLIIPFLYLPALPWVVRHLFVSRKMLNWKPRLLKPILPSSLTATYCNGWQRIRCGEEVNLPIIVKELKEEGANLIKDDEKITFDDFKFKVWKIKGGFALSWALNKGEHLYGLGERFYSFDLGGQRQVLWVMDAIGSNSTQRLYKPIPFLLSSSGYGIFVHTASLVLFDATNNYCLVAVKGPLDIWRIKGRPKEVISFYTELTGKPPLVPKWSFGLWISRCMYPDRKTVEEVADRLRKEGIPSDVISLDPWWLKGRYLCLRDATTFEWNLKRFPKPKEMLERLKERSFKLCLWVNPYLPLFFPIFEEAKAKGYLVKRKRKIALTTDGPAALVNFSDDEATRWYKDKLIPLLKDGVEVFKTDYGEGAPPEADYKKYPSIFMHNLYPFLYNRAVFDAVKELKGKGILWSRSAWAGSQRFPVHWSGDPKCSWHDLRHLLIGGLNFSLSGFAYWSNDIGGFVGKPSSELFIRWAEFGLFVSNARLHGMTPREPWVFGKEALKVFKFYVKLRYRLIPYLYTYAHIASQTGHPILRPMVFEFPEDENTHTLKTQYMLGEKLLVAPVLEKGKKEKKVYFPEGEWFNWFTPLQFATGFTLKRFLGPSWQIVEAPLDILPIFVRSNSIIPLGPEIDYIDEKKEPLTLLVFNPQNSSFTLYDDEEKITFTSFREKGEIILTITPSKKSYIAQFYGVRGKELKGENLDIHEVKDMDNFFIVSFTTSGEKSLIRFAI